MEIAYGIVFTLAILGHLSTGEDVCWSRYGDYQYKVLAPSGGSLYFDAVDYCTNINTSIASIHSQDEETFLEAFVMSQMSVPLWIGLRRENSDLGWADGTDVDYVSHSYTPKDTREGCVYMFMGWNEESCRAANLHFICKRQVIDADACPTTTVALSSTTEAGTTTTEAKATSTTEATTLSEPLTTAEATTNGAFTSDVTSDLTYTTSSQDTTTENIDLKKTTKDVTTQNDSPSTSNSESSTTTLRTTTIPVTSPTNRVTQTTREVKKNRTTTTAYEPPGTTEHVQTFQEMLDEMTLKKKPVYNVQEGAHSTAIGSVSILILIIVLVGVVLLDLNTIRKHLSMIKKNTKDVCKRNNKTDIIYVK